jgi:hypothetical protein
MSFLRHEEIYRSDVRLGQSWERQPVSSLPVLIGCDEFPVGYSLAGCPPAEPASASPTRNDSQQPTLPYNDFSANGNNPLNFVSQPKGALQNGALPLHPIPKPCWHGYFARGQSLITGRSSDSRFCLVYRRCGLIPSIGNASALTGRENPGLQPDILIVSFVRELSAMLFRASAVGNILKDSKRKNEHSSKFRMENTTGGA